MALATLTSKGQITLPKAIRERLGLTAGDRVDFRLDEAGRVLLVPRPRQALAELYGALACDARSLDLAAMDDAIADAVVRRDTRSRR